MAKITVATVVFCGLIAHSALAAPQGQPSVTINATTIGSGVVSGTTQNVDPGKYKVVIFAQTNQYYVQPFTVEPFTDIQSNGSWSNWTHPWTYLVVLVADPTIYSPPAIDPVNPATDPATNTGVIAWTMYPGPSTLMFSGYQWAIKASGTDQGSQVAPGPNFWSNNQAVVSVQPNGYLRLSNAQVDGNWESAEVYLNQPLGYGNYTVQIASPLDHLDVNTVAAPLFIYKDYRNAEFDNEYSGLAGLITSPYTAQFVAQPFSTAGNIVRYFQPAAAQFTSQIEWRVDHVRFRTWNGWSDTPVPNGNDQIIEWFYTGPNNFQPGQDRVHINLWLDNGAPPTSGTGDTMIIKSFNFQPPMFAPVAASPAGLDFNAAYSSGQVPPAQVINITSAAGAVDFTAWSGSPWLMAWLAGQVPESTTPTTVLAAITQGTLTPGIYRGSITLASGANSTQVPVTLTITESGSPCDVYNNGTINVAGAQKVVNEALGLQSPADDLNHDGAVNVVDAELVANAVLNLGCKSS